jgi:hypothetical protein
MMDGLKYQSLIWGCFFNLWMILCWSFVFLKSAREYLKKQALGKSFNFSWESQQFQQTFNHSKNHPKNSTEKNI